MQQVLISASILAVVVSTALFNVGENNNMRLDLVIDP